MPLRNIVTSCVLIAGLIAVGPARRAEAGPLLDWLFHRPSGPAVPIGAPYAVGYAPVAAGYAPVVANYGALPYTAGYTPYSTGYAPVARAPYTSGYTPYGVAYPTIPTTPVMTAPAALSPAATYGTYYGAASPIVGANGYAYMSQRPNTGAILSAPAVMPSTMAPAVAAPSVATPAPVTLVPDYRSSASRTPVTYYRPIMTTDPTTGAQVVTLAPCSSYEYQTQRVPTWGLTQVYNGGASLPAVSAVAPPVTPTYSLPRGGVPLSGGVAAAQPYGAAYAALMPPVSSVTPVAPTTGSIITPAAPYSSGYGAYSANPSNYSALQPPVGMSQTGTYQTAPMGSGLGSYYNSGNTIGSGSTGGGSTGSFGAPITSAPSASAPMTSNPYATGPYGTSPYPASPTTPYSAPPAGGSVLPPSDSGLPTQPGLPPMQMPVLPPSNDPAAGVVPSLPLPPIQSGAKLESKPQLQNIVQQPMPGQRSFGSSPSHSSPSTSSQSAAGSADKPVKEVAPGLLPIPVPDDFKHEPRWNPGLLKEQDTTASTNTANEQVHLVSWESKPIQWASFNDPRSPQTPSANDRLELAPPKSGLRSKSLPAVVNPEPVRANRAMTPEASGLSLVPANAVDSPTMVPLSSATQTASPPANDRLELTPAGAQAPAPPSTSMPATRQPDSRYPTGGWQPAAGR